MKILCLGGAGGAELKKWDIHVHERVQVLLG